MSVSRHKKSFKHKNIYSAYFNCPEAYFQNCHKSKLQRSIEKSAQFLSAASKAVRKKEPGNSYTAW